MQPEWQGPGGVCRPRRNPLHPAALYLLLTGDKHVMGIFSSIMDKIFHHESATPASAPAADASSGAAPTPGQAPAAAPQNVDVGAVLSQMATTRPGGNYQTSIVDLLKLLDLDSSLEARKELASELNVHAGADGSAEENIALHKAVMQKLAENGGKVPDSMRG
ncbi:MAG: DUF3597 domain-containing protein [Acetobacteraceae bacterium]